MSFCTWPFDSAVIGTATVSVHDVIPGTSEFSVSGADGSQSLADGTILFYRKTVLKTALFYAFGDKRDLATGAGQCVSVSLYAGNTLFCSFYAQIRTEYEIGENRTLLTAESV